jgi:hypothetical protein
MTELVVITAASSVLGTLTFGYFVWLGLGLRKALNQTEQNLNKVIELNKLVDEEFANTWRRVDSETANLNSRIDDIADRLHKNMDGITESQRHSVNLVLDEIDNVRKEIDRRFDRVYLKLYTEFPQLKDAEQVTNN